MSSLLHYFSIRTRRFGATAWVLAFLAAVGAFARPRPVAQAHDLAGQVQRLLMPAVTHGT